jgi:hypothetical protein
VQALSNSILQNDRSVLGSTPCNLYFWGSPPLSFRPLKAPSLAACDDKSRLIKNRIFFGFVLGAWVLRLQSMIRQQVPLSASPIEAVCRVGGHVRLLALISTLDLAL